MLHADRVWSVAEVSSVEELAEKLTGTTWCCCQGFRIAGQPHYVWLNDSTSEDGAQEYAVCRLELPDADMRQVESITFGWSDYARALEYILSTLRGEDDENEWARSVTATLQSPQEHGRCPLCA